MVAILGCDVPTWLCVTGPVLVAIWRYLTPSCTYFIEIGVPYLKPWPIVGNIMGIMTQGILDHDDSLKRKFGQKVVGLFDGTYPMLMVYDLDMLKEILVKHFSSFQNHKAVGLSEYPMRKMMTQIESDHWKHVRNQLTPTFSGGKLRRMTETVNRCSSNMVHFLKQKMNKEEVVELKRESGKFTMDVIAGTAFGIDINSFGDEDNVFADKARRMLESFDGQFSLKLLMLIAAPKLMKYSKTTMFPKDVMDFFLGVINESLKRRGENEHTAKDYLQLMVKAHVDDPKEEDVQINDDLVKTKDGVIYSKKGLTHEEILAQSILFFLAGFDTTSTQLSFLCFNLATHPEAQEKLYQEIVDVMGDLKEPNYDVIKQMPYLQMCIEENSRLYPSVPRLDRICNESTDINGLLIKKGTVIGVPVWTIHHDPEVYPEPYKFIPERFNADEKAKRHPMAWMPFGQGPRNCVGMRLALMEIKFAVIHLLMNFKLVTCPETEVPPKLKKSPFQVIALNGLQVKLEARN